MGCHHFELHTGLELLLRRYRSSIHRSTRMLLFARRTASLCDARSIPGVSRNFSALRLCKRSHPFLCLIAGSSYTVINLHQLPCCTTCSRSPFPCVSFQRSVGHTHGGTGWTRTSSLLSGLPLYWVPSSLLLYLLSYCPMVPGSRRAQFWLAKRRDLSHLVDKDRSAYFAKIAGFCHLISKICFNYATRYQAELKKTGLIFPYSSTMYQSSASISAWDASQPICTPEVPTKASALLPMLQWLTFTTSPELFL